MSSPPAGWYPDPEMAGTQRYWDGSVWTEHRAPAAVTRPVAGPVEVASSSVLAAGWVFAVVVPIVGFVIGLSQINRSREGLWIVLLSVGAAIFWFWAFTSGGL